MEVLSQGSVMKLCQDCKHYRPNYRSLVEHTCTHERFASPIDGSGASAVALRDGACGRDGKFWESSMPKPSDPGTEQVNK